MPIFLLANVILGVVMPYSCTGAYPRNKGGIQVLAGLVPPSQKVESLLITPRLAKPYRTKNGKK